jgi:hypothetical protein
MWDILVAQLLKSGAGGAEQGGESNGDDEDNISRLPGHCSWELRCR